jgi:hypothetical protein
MDNENQRCKASILIKMCGFATRQKECRIIRTECVVRWIKETGRVAVVCGGQLERAIPSYRLNKGTRTAPIIIKPAQDCVLVYGFGGRTTAKAFCFQMPQAYVNLPPQTLVIITSLHPTVPYHCFTPRSTYPGSHLGSRDTVFWHSRGHPLSLQINDEIT